MENIREDVINMINLLDETNSKLAQHGKSLKDVLCVSGDCFRITKDDFIKLADTYYDNGFGGQQIASDLKLFGTDFLMYRNEYDGAEWWEYISTEVPKELRSVSAITIDQANQRPEAIEKNASFLTGSKLKTLNKPEFYMDEIAYD